MDSSSVAQENISRYLDELGALIARLPIESIERVVKLLVEARESGRQIIIMGNGGSAATASHFACDLGKGTVMPGVPRFRVVALTDNMSVFSAYANDLGYDQVFSEQLRNLVQPGDVVIGISGSGKSVNVLNAMQVARQANATTVGFVGFDGGDLKNLVDMAIHVPSDNMEQIEDAHLILEHVVSTTVRSLARQEQVDGTRLLEAV